MTIKKSLGIIKNTTEDINILKRLEDIDVAIGISIALVVFGHLLFDENTLTWYIIIREALYKFHMSLFMFLSGFIMAYTYKPIKNTHQYISFIKIKAQKFIPAYFLFSILYLIIEGVIYDYSVDQLKFQIMNIIINPSKSPAGFLWYIYVLFQFYIILPLLMRLAEKNIFILVLIGIFLQFINNIDFLNFNLFSFYFLFISLGIIASKYLELYYHMVTKFGYLFLFLFILVVIWNYNYNVPKVIIGLISIPAIHFISNRITLLKLNKLTSLMGRYSFYIYLMNTLVSGSLFFLFIKVLHLRFNTGMLLFLFFSGACFPILVYKKIIKKFSFLNKLIQ